MAGSQSSEAPPPYSASQPSPDENTPLLPPPYQAPTITSKPTTSTYMSTTTTATSTSTSTYMSTTTTTATSILTTSPPPARRLFKSQTQNRSRHRNANGNKRCRILLLSLLAASIFLSLTSTYLSIFFPFHTPSPPPILPPVRIAIVGAGPAGIAAAFQLSDECKTASDKRRVEIVVFERKQLVGGRMALDVDLGGDWSTSPRVRSGDVAGGDLFPAGGVLRGRAERFLGVEFGKEGDAGVRRQVGFFDGERIVSRATRPWGEMSWWQWGSWVWRYGGSVGRARKLPAGVMEGFEKLLNAEEVFDGVREMVEAAGIREAVSMSARDRLTTNRVGDLYRDEVVEQQVRRQFGQGTEEISDLALSMALQRDDQAITSGGRLEEVLTEFLTKSKAEVRVATEVTNIRPEYVDGHRNGWRLELGKETHEVFDKVILAGFWNTTVDDYRHLWIDFIVTDGKLNADYFRIEENTQLSQIQIIDNPALPSELKGVHEITHVRDLYGPDLSAQAVHKLYRVVSDNSISENLISRIGGEGTLGVLHVKNRYPLLYPRSEGFSKFKIQDGLYSTAVVEEIASSVDLSWVAGENVANLVRKEIDEESKMVSLS